MIRSFLYVSLLLGVLQSLCACGRPAHDSSDSKGSAQGRGRAGPVTGATSPSPSAPELVLAKHGERCGGFGGVRCDAGLLCVITESGFDKYGVCDLQKP